MSMINKSMEDIFDDMKPMDNKTMNHNKSKSSEDENTSKELAEQKEERKELNKRLQSLRKINNALTEVHELDSHDKEMDDIAKHALESYQDMINRGASVQDKHVADVFDAAAKMLNISLDAKDAKAKRRLKTIEMQLKCSKLELDNKRHSNSNNSDNEKENDGQGRQNISYNRNYILQVLKGETDESMPQSAEEFFESQDDNENDGFNNN